MLVIKAVEDQPSRGIKKGDEFRLYIVDAHHHMGREKSHKNTPAGAYEFYASLWFEVQKQSKTLMENDTLLFEPIGIESPLFAGKVFRSKTSWKRLDHGWLIDRTVVFPYTDDYSAPETPGEPSFKVSNDKIAAWTTRAPHSARLIGFSRVNPKDGGQIAVHELERSVLKLGLRGLKLHPLAQLFIDSIEEDITKQVVKRAGELGLPVIFDTRNMKTVVRIKRLVDSMRNDPHCGNALRGLKVIAAHCGMSPGDSRLYEALKDPIIFGETSTLHDKDVPVLFESVSNRLANWSDKIIFGTDFSFLSVQAVDVIMYLLSRSFQGSLSDAQRILGGNMLLLLRTPYRTFTKSNIQPTEFVYKDKTQNSQRDLEDKVLTLLAKGNWELCSLDLMIPPAGTWPVIKPLSRGGLNGVEQDSYVLTLKNNENEYHLWIRRRPGNFLSCTILPAQGMVQLDSLENASQKLSPVLLRSLADNSIVLESLKDLETHVLSLLT